MIESAGILAYRNLKGQLEFFLVHPGGPFFSKKDAGFWTIPKGIVEDGEDLLTAAKREFLEETGFKVSGKVIPLGYITQKGGKRVHCFAVESDFDAAAIVSNTFEIAWPPNSGRMQSYPEVDRAGWFNLAEAKLKINERQAELLSRLTEHFL